MFELINLFSFFGILFYFVLPALVISLAMVNDHIAFAYLAVIGAILGIFVLSEVKIGATLHWIFSHPLQDLMVVGSYVFLGIIWSLIKWNTFSRDQRKVFNSKREDWFKRYIDRGEALNKDFSFKQFVKNTYDIPPNPFDHVNDINVWMGFWPFSVVGTFFGDYLYRFFKWIYNLFSGLYTYISEAAFKGTELQ